MHSSFSLFWPVGTKVYVSHENTSVSAAILCPGICIIDIINKADIRQMYQVPQEPTLLCLVLNNEHMHVPIKWLTSNSNAPSL